MDPHAGRGAEVALNGERLCGRGVDRAHEPLRPVGSDRNHRQADPREPLSDPAEDGGVAGIAREERVAGGAREDKPAPERPVAVPQAAAREVLDGRGGDRQRLREPRLLPPVEFRDRFDSIAFEQAPIAEPGHDGAAMPAQQLVQRGEIEVIVVVMADRDRVERRQVFHPDAGRPVTGRPDPGDRADAAGPDRVRQDVGAAGLEECGRVIDERYAHVGHARRGPRSGRGRGPAAPWARVAGRHPPDEIEKAPCIELRVVKAAAVEVVRARSAVARRGERQEDRDLVRGLAGC